MGGQPGRVEASARAQLGRPTLPRSSCARSRRRQDPRHPPQARPRPVQRDGPQVRNAKGTLWSTAGDANLGSRPPPRRRPRRRRRRRATPSRTTIPRAPPRSPTRRWTTCPDVVSSRRPRTGGRSRTPPRTRRVSSRLARGHRGAGLEVRGPDRELQEQPARAPRPMAKKWALDTSRASSAGAAARREGRRRARRRGVGQGQVARLGGAGEGQGDRRRRARQAQGDRRPGPRQGARGRRRGAGQAQGRSAAACSTRSSRSAVARSTGSRPSAAACSTRRRRSPAAPATSAPA